MLKKIIFSITFSVMLLSCSVLLGGIMPINGKLSDDKYAPIYPLHKHFELGCQCMAERDWKESLANFLVITTHFPESEFFAESLYRAGICYYYLEDFQLADRHFCSYLEQKVELKYFEEVFEYKFHIAEAFRLGARRHLFNFASFPKLLSAHEQAITIYDEVISSLPHKDLGAHALYGKAELLRGERKYKESIETLNTLIKRFLKHPKASDAYLLISEIYVEEGRFDTQNPDLLALAHVNLNHFKKDFPSDEKLSLVERNIAQMSEIFAKSLYDTGRFYERKKKPKASRIYYEEAIKRYPETACATQCRERLNKLRSDV